MPDKDKKDKKEGKSDKKRLESKFGWYKGDTTWIPPKSKSEDKKK